MFAQTGNGYVDVSVRAVNATNGQDLTAAWQKISSQALVTNTFMSTFNALLSNSGAKPFSHTWNRFKLRQYKRKRNTPCTSAHSWRERSGGNQPSCSHLCLSYSVHRQSLHSVCFVMAARSPAVCLAVSQDLAIILVRRVEWKIDLQFLCSGQILCLRHLQLPMRGCREGF